MWRNPSFLILISIVFLWSSCQDGAEEKEADTALYQVTDFTSEGVFTSGIEGPSFVGGKLYVVNYDHQGSIGVCDGDGNCELFVDLPEGSIGNGIRANDVGDLFIADYTGHNVLKIDRESRTIHVYAHNDSMNQPNDLAIRSDGVLFASDPLWKESTGQLWRIDLDGTVTLLEQGMGTTNGVEISPDEKYLYVNESVARVVWRYDLDEGGNISNKTVFHQFEDFGMDGMRCDTMGNLFVTRHGKGTVAILNANGELVREVTFKGKKPSNIAFGGEDGRTCFVTLQDRGAIEYFRTEHAGRSFRLTKN